MLAKADLDGDGCISFEEFDLLSSTFSPVRAPKLRDAFDHFDSEGTGGSPLRSCSGSSPRSGTEIYADIPGSARLIAERSPKERKFKERGKREEGRGYFCIFLKRAKISLK